MIIEEYSLPFLSINDPAGSFLFDRRSATCLTIASRSIRRLAGKKEERWGFGVIGGDVGSSDVTYTQMNTREVLPPYGEIRGIHKQRGCN